MAVQSVALIPGDGIGPEVLREGRKVMDAVAEVTGVTWQWKEYPFGAEHWLKHRKGLPTLMSEEEMAQLATHDAIYFGAVGDPRVPEQVEQAGALLWMRFYFDQYINLRPAKLLRGVVSPLAGKKPHDINFYVVRENSEDFYIGLGGRFAGRRNRDLLELRRALYKAKFQVDIDIDPEDQIAYQIGAITGRGAERVIRYGFELAKRKHLTRVTVVHKANVLTKIYGLWMETAERVAKEYPSIEFDTAIVDAVTMWFVRRPEWFQVVVAPNMFGDIISDLAAATVGGMGFAPGGNINPDRKAGVSMFEPIHGSAPKHGGFNRANPIATILAGKLMLEHLGEERAAELVEHACEDILEAGKVRTYDMGGNSTCSDMGDAISERILQLKP
ncbi:MAG: 3-isopropylmalate dehydrogenase [Deltaproteobacteria bacterium HGW-Deltaproteobacteria-15]|jgi:3-isopropylmalate dehydrogenase|nr:MAG: 3-isopropylmalate dehydrogenase [Deltaproteobacteria bacterium HGW-Deltaproteobacteria-15]